MGSSYDYWGDLCPQLYMFLWMGLLHKFRNRGRSPTTISKLHSCSCSSSRFLESPTQYFHRVHSSVYLNRVIIEMGGFYLILSRLVSSLFWPLFKWVHHKLGTSILYLPRIIFNGWIKVQYKLGKPSDWRFPVKSSRCLFQDPKSVVGCVKKCILRKFLKLWNWNFWKLILPEFASQGFRRKLISCLFGNANE